MKRQKAISAIMTTIGRQDVVVSTTGLISREIFEKFDSERNVYVPGSMGLGQVPDKLDIESVCGQ